MPIALPEGVIEFAATGEDRIARSRVEGPPTMPAVHPCLRCARHIRVTDERCPFCDHAAFARPCTSLALCAALTLAACARNAPLETPLAAVAVPDRVMAVPDAETDPTHTPDASASDVAAPSEDVAPPATDAAAPTPATVVRRGPRQRATVVRPEREDVPLYGVSPKGWKQS